MDAILELFNKNHIDSTVVILSLSITPLLQYAGSTPGVIRFLLALTCSILAPQTICLLVLGSVVIHSIVGLGIRSDMFFDWVSEALFFAFDSITGFLVVQSFITHVLCCLTSSLKSQRERGFSCA